MTLAQRKKHDRAYLFFIFPGLASLAAALGGMVPMDTGSAAGLGFFVLIPLALVGLITVPVGIYYSVVFWRDGVLPCLSILTILLFVEITSEAGSAAFYNATTGPVYGLASLGLEASWFFWRRWRAVESPDTSVERTRGK